MLFRFRSLHGMLILKEKEGRKKSEPVLPSFLTPDSLELASGRLNHVLRTASSVFDSEMVPAVLGRCGMAHRRLGTPAPEAKDHQGSSQAHEIVRTIMPFVKRSMLACVLVTVLICLLLTAQVAQAAQQSGWGVIPSPNVGTRPTALNGVAAVSASDVWAVGTHGSSSGNRTLIEHWNGSSWSIVKSPNAGTSFNGLNSVAVTSASDIWAVGYYIHDDGGYAQTLIEHWNGSSWSIVKSPSPSSSDNGLSGVAVVAASDVWAVGISRSSDAQTLIEHWNGSSWSIVKSPSPGSSYNDLSGVVALSAHNIWAVGRYTSYDSGYAQTLIEHWDGSSWSIVKSPNRGANNLLYGVTAVSASNIWAVGSDGNTLIEHWNGSSWSVVPSPSPGANDNNFLIKVATVSSNSVWAVGVYQDDSGNYQTLIEHWNGSSWSVVPSPSPGISYSALAGVVRVPTTHQVWAVGYYRNSSGVNQTLTEFHG